MLTRLRVGATIALACLVTLAVTVERAVAAAPVEIKQCFITAPKPLSQRASGTQIVYRNATNKTITRVRFNVRYATHSAQIADAGSFAPGVTIDHHFTTMNDQIWHGKNVSACYVRFVGFSDGTTWQS